VSDHPLRDAELGIAVAHPSNGRSSKERAGIARSPIDSPTPAGSADVRRRILVLANEECAGPTLRLEILRRDRGTGVEVLMVAPALTDRLRFWMSDVDRAVDRAQERLDHSIEKVATRGLRIRGVVGDADPLQALEDALGTFDPEEVIIVTHPIGSSNWLERAVVEQARQRHVRPITHIEVDLEHHRVEVNPPRVVPEWLVRESHQRRDWLILGVLAVLAIVGTWLSFIFYVVDAPVWFITAWVLVADIGFKFVALPLALWMLFERRARADRLDY